LAASVNSDNQSSVEKILQLIDTLRGENGCPWDQQQTPTSMAPFLIEEAYELVDAVIGNDAKAVCEEAGDVLFQLLFLIHLFSDAGHFKFEEVVEHNLEKMVRRHPHVFGDTQADSPEMVKDNWEKIKKKEKGETSRQSILASISQGLPALLRASLVSERAAKTGFDWEDLFGVMEKAKEEWLEFSDEVKRLETKDGKDNASTEFGDILFTLVNVARFAGIHPETALIQSIKKFEKRFFFMEEKALEMGRQIESMSIQEMHTLWAEAKDRVG
jgi:tetrapyrrole methylase family protein/MazG family protein